MSAASSRSYGPTHEHISIPVNPAIPSELTMAKYRIVIEDERSGQEYKGYSGLNRAACDRIIALINSVGAHDLLAGSIPSGKNAQRKLIQWARDVGHTYDRKPPRPVPARGKRPFTGPLLARKP